MTVEILNHGFLDIDFSNIFTDNIDFHEVDTSKMPLSKTHDNLFNNINCKIFQKFIDKDDIKNFDNIEKKLPLLVEYVSVIKQYQGSINATHVDKFYKLRDKKNKYPVRLNVFLTDWSFGQTVMTPKKTFTHWKKGEYCLWNNTVEHMAINFSVDIKVTMQFSGYLK
jgi:hypothetical protein